MTETVRVLDERRWRLHLYWADFLALGLFGVLVVSLFFDMYSLGASATAAAAGVDVYERDAIAARMVGQAAVAAVAFAWLSYRVILGGFRALEARS